MNQSDKNLYSLVPRIKRARDYYLYDYDGKRYVDLYLGNGSCILGHKALRQTTILKDVLSKGLLTDLPSMYMKRLENALASLFPEYKSFIIGASIDEVLDHVKESTGADLKKTDIYDPLFPGHGDSKAPISVWRPFFVEEAQKSDAILPVLPFSISNNPSIVCLKQEIKQRFAYHISPFILAGLTRALYDLNKYKKPDWLSDILKAVPGRWDSRGIYLIPLFDQITYEEIFPKFLSEGYLLSPNYPGPSILPAEISKGELQKMLSLFRTIPVL
jgi:hypothetical protein